MRGLSERSVLSYTPVDLTELALKLDIFLPSLLTIELPDTCMTSGSHEGIA